MTQSDLNWTKSIHRLHQLEIYSRWLFVLACWLILGSFGIWGLRGEIELWREYFTWAAFRYGLAYNLVPAFCLFFCIGITVAVLVWQSQILVKGLSDREKYRLEQQVKKIHAAGTRHPLWHWIFGKNV